MSKPMRFILVLTLTGLFHAVALADIRLAKPAPAIEKLTPPVQFSTREGGGVFKNADGDMHLVVMYNAHPIQLADFNLTTGKVVVRDLPGAFGRGAHKLALSAAGKLLVGCFDQFPTPLYLYDPAAGEVGPRLEYTAFFDKGVQSLVIGPDGAFYLGSSPMGMIARFDPTHDEKIEVLNFVETRKGEFFVYTIGADDRYVYCGMGQNPWYLAIYDRLTGDVVVHKDKSWVTQGEDGGWYCQGVYDSKGKLYRLARGKAVELSPAERSKVRFKPWYRQTNVLADPAVYEKETGYAFELKDLNATGWNNGTVTLRFRPPKSEEWKTLTAGGIRVAPASVKRMAVLDDGRLFGTTDMYGPVFTYDPKTDKSTYIGPAHGNTYSLLVDGPLVYTGGYTALPLVYDTRQPWRQEVTNVHVREGNPHELPVPAHKYGDYLAKGADGRIYSVWRHIRDSSGSHLSSYDAATNKGELLVRKELEDQSVRDMKATLNGRYIVLTCQRQGGDHKNTILIYDTNIHAISSQITDLPNGDWAKVCPCGGDDMLVVSKDGWVCRLNVATGKRAFAAQLPAGKTVERAFGPGYSYYWQLERGPDGWAWCIIGNDLCRIDPTSGKAETVAATGRTRFIFSGTDVYLYGTTFSRISGLFAR